MSSASVSRRRGAAGYVLLEALIAVVVAAVGFVGAARMQTFIHRVTALFQREDADV